MLTAAASALFAGCFASQSGTEQEQDIQPLGSIAACDSTVADICLAAADPQTCLTGLGGVCSAVIAVDTATCEAKFTEACASYGLDKVACEKAAQTVCGAFVTPGVCYDDAYTACKSLGGDATLCDSVANSLCNSPAIVSCSDFVGKLCAAIPLSPDQCTDAQAALCAAGGAPGTGTGGGTGGGTGTGGGNGGGTSPTDPTSVVGPASGAACPAYIQSICDANNVPQDQCDARIAAYCK